MMKRHTHGCGDTSMQNNYSTWLTTQQAAQALNVSLKTLQGFAKAKKLQTARYQRPSDSIYETRYHPDDVERLRMERNPEAEPFVMPPVENAATAIQRTENRQTNGNADAAIAFLENFANAVRSDPAVVTLREKVFLTMPEAVQLTGLPDAVIRRMIYQWQMHGAKEIHAIMTGQGWRVRRKDLEAL
jgi:hypothetical protein